MMGIEPERSADQEPRFTERFRTVERIGEGGAGLVYRLYDTQTQRFVAAKVLRSQSAENLLRLKREFRALSRITHPNVVRLYELFVSEHHCFFSMELVAGMEFDQYCREALGLPDPRRGSPHAFDRLASLLTQLASGLSVLHDRGFVHRDVKPSNLLVEDSGRVVLLDFGLASDLNSELSRRSVTSEFAGTIAYMSPEQYEGAPLSSSSDWYSVGILLYEVLTGQRPGWGSTSSRASPRPRGAVVPPSSLASGIPDVLDRLTVALLAENPSERPTGGDVLRALQRLSARTLTSVPAPVTPQRALLLGRERELWALRDALASSRDRTTIAYLEGASGLGKSSILRAFARMQSLQGALVFGGRCHHRERLAFKALDELVDDLSRHLSWLPE